MKNELTGFRFWGLMSAERESRKIGTDYLLTIKEMDGFLNF